VSPGGTARAGFSQILLDVAGTGTATSTLTIAKTTNTATMAFTTTLRSYPHARATDRPPGAGARCGVGRTTTLREEVGVSISASD